MEKRLSKKLIVAFGAVLMAVAMLIPAVAFASTLTITNTLAGKQYDAYVFFSVDANGKYVFNKSSHFNEGFNEFNTAHPDAFVITDIDGTYAYVTPTATFTEDLAAELALTMYRHYDSWMYDEHATQVATSDTVVFDDIDDGYYIVKSSSGTVLSMVAVNGSGTINEKNTEGRFVELEYNIERDAIGYYEWSNVETIAKFVENYDKNTMTLRITNDYTYDHNTLMQPSVFLIYTGKVDPATGEVYDLQTLSANDYDLESGDYDYTFTLRNSCPDLKAGDAVVIRCLAHIDGDLAIYSSESGQTPEHTSVAHALNVFGNLNEEVGTASDSFRVLGMSLTKLGDTGFAVLNGAKFQLYNELQPTQPVAFMKQGNNYFVAESGSAGSVNELEVGVSYISGLGSGTYTFKETQAPEGYNMLTTPATHELTNDSDFAIITDVEGVPTWASGGLTVVNRSGIIIPGTGGIGTLIFTLIGAGILISAIAYRMSRKRVNNSGVDVTS